ncbi:hypothetical protein Tco_1335747 [Tanacetum coccineum]
MAAGVAVVNGHTEQGYKLKSLVNSFRHGVNVSDLRLFSSLLQSSVSVRDVKTTQSDDCLKQWYKSYEITRFLASWVHRRFISIVQKEQMGSLKFELQHQSICEKKP